MQKNLGSLTFIGMDVGTSNIKATLINLKGDELAFSQMKNEVITVETGHSEMSMSELWQRCCAVLQELARQHSLNNVAAMSISGQGEGLWLLDEQKQAIEPAILWNDDRARKITQAWLNDADLNDFIRNTTGSIPFSGATTVLLAWLKQYRPEIYQKIATIFWCKDWIRFCLTNEINTDFTDASTSILNMQTCSIDDVLFDKLGLAPLQNNIAPLKQSTQIAGYVSKLASRLTGIPEGVAVATGALDIVTSAVGAGACKANDICTILGTTCCNEVIVSNFKPDKQGVAGYECYAFDDLYLHVSAAMAGTPNLDWAITNLLSREERQHLDLYKYIEDKVQSIEIGSGGVLYHPYINSAGERAPFAHSGAKAQFFGINEKTTRWHLLRAVYEGIAFSICDCLDDKNDNNKGAIYLSGGGAESYFWAQMIANCTGRDVHIPQYKELCARGGALYAALSVNAFNDFNEGFNAIAKVKITCKSNQDHHLVYQRYFKIYRQIREQLMNSWSLHQQLLNKLGATSNELSRL